jgi:hypothetical protein
MLIGRCLLIILMRSTLIIAALTSITSPNPQYNSLSTWTQTRINPSEQSSVLVLSYSTVLAATSDQNECQHPCSIDYCLKYVAINKNCTKLIRDQCDCCTVCLRSEHQICGGHLNVYGLCEQDLLCHQTNRTQQNHTEQTGICIQSNHEDNRLF